ncbi:sigma-70 family RNA polymerase sigma factor [Arthrobacter woluwensis]|uniref:sigma-70 family RNA polymerase sigma factor n=1 Tax=Arthrobacter woluwensis TaxID=156980 RepID=UPI00380F8642
MIGILLLRRSDVELLALTRSGDMVAFGALFAKHRASAYRIAYGLTHDHGAAEDAVNDTFAAVLAAIKSGRGPQGVFLPYLLSSVSRTVWRNSRRRRREVPADDLDSVGETPEVTDRVIAAFENESARKAFESLPERWRMIIWYLDIEDMQPKDVAPSLGLSPNAAVVLHRRAKRALRVAYLRELLGQQESEDCQFTIEYVPSYLNGTLTARKKAWFHRHLETCRTCRKAITELLDSGVFRVQDENRPPGWPWKDYMTHLMIWTSVALIVASQASNHGLDPTGLLHRINASVISHSAAGNP